MGFRYTRVQVEALPTFIGSLPTSVRIVGTLGGAPLGQVAFILESPLWPDAPEDQPIAEVSIKIDDRSKALCRTVEIKEVSAIIGAGAKSVILPGNA